MSKELALFKELFTPCPNISILHIDKSLNLINQTIEEIRASNDGNIKYIKFNEQKDARLHAVAREYEYVILSNIIASCANKDKILQLIYKAIENSGNIIIIEDKKHQNKDEIMTLLDELGFTASNSIDLFEDHELITAKKMHHWGRGL